MSEHDRTVKPSGSHPPAGKAAVPAGEMGPPHSPTGPNETEAGIIPKEELVPPGEDQVGLVGGDPGEAQTSQTGNKNYDEAEAKRVKAEKEAEGAAKASRSARKT